MIPSFAVGRTQELLYFLRQIKADGLISGHDGFEVYVDSPLAVESTEIFQDNRRDYFDQEALELLNRGINPHPISRASGVPYQRGIQGDQ